MTGRMASGTDIFNPLSVFSSGGSIGRYSGNVSSVICDKMKRGNLLWRKKFHLTEKCYRKGKHLFLSETVFTKSHKKPKRKIPKSISITILADCSLTWQKLEKLFWRAIGDYCPKKLQKMNVITSTFAPFGTRLFTLQRGCRGIANSILTWNISNAANNSPAFVSPR